MLDKGDSHIWDYMYNCHMPSKAYMLNSIFYRRMHVCMYVSSLNVFTNSINSNIVKNLSERPTVKKQLETNSKTLFQYPDIN